MYFDFKVETWERVVVSEKFEEAITKEIKEGRITSSLDIYAFLENQDEPSLELLLETTAQLSVEDNSGCATIEIMDDNKNKIWDNE